MLKERIFKIILQVVKIKKPQRKCASSSLAYIRTFPGSCCRTRCKEKSFKWTLIRGSRWMRVSGWGSFLQRGYHCGPFSLKGFSQLETRWLVRFCSLRAGYNRLKQLPSVPVDYLNAGKGTDHLRSILAIWQTSWGRSDSSLSPAAKNILSKSLQYTKKLNCDLTVFFFSVSVMIYKMLFFFLHFFVIRSQVSDTRLGIPPTCCRSPLNQVKSSRVLIPLITDSGLFVIPWTGLQMTSLRNCPAV